MGSDPSLIEFESRRACAERLADFIGSELARAIAERGTAAIAVSGGSTPEALYKELSTRALDWAKVTAVLVDERWVSPGEAGSNESFVRSALVANRATETQIIGLWSSEPTPKEGLAEALGRIAGIKRFDAVVLGMGNDGHTASWFPHCGGLAGALAMSGPSLAAVRAKKSEIAGDFLDRMTLTLGAVASARSVSLLLAGADKRATFERARGEGPVEEMPVRAIMRARPDMWVCWAP